MHLRSGLVLVMTLVAPIAFGQGRRQPLQDPPSRSAGAAPGDEERAKAIEAQLQSDAVLRDDLVNIQVTGKNVRLTGTVDGPDERAHAEDLVRQSDPTLTVENLLQSADDVAPSKRVEDSTRRAGQRAEEAAKEVGDMATDGWITSKIKTQLISAEGVRASTINVDTSDHVVTLRGTVRSEAERKKALDIAKQTRGVREVVDELTIPRRTR